MYTSSTPALGAVAATTAAAGATSQSGVLSAGATGVQPVPGSGATVAAAVQTLPFTGVNVFFLILSAITLILMGAALIRIGRTLTTHEATA